MQLNNLTLFRQMEQKMHWLSTRQSVLAENVANADTPAYTPRDLKPFTGASSTQLAAPLIMASTDGGAYMSQQWRLDDPGGAEGPRSGGNQPERQSGFAGRPADQGWRNRHGLPDADQSVSQAAEHDEDGPGPQHNSVRED